MGLINRFSSRHDRPTRHSLERPRTSTGLFITVAGILLAITASVTFDKMEGRVHRNMTAETSATPAVLLVRSGPARAKVDQIALTDAKII